MGSNAVCSLILASLVWVWGCSSKPSSGSNCSGDACDAGADQFASDSATSTDSPPDSTQNCSDSDVPDDNLVDSNCDGIDGDAAHAIFVSPDGSDSAAGTMDAPVATVAKGVALASTAGKDVYICNALYVENVTVTGKAVGLYGGFDCTAGWTRSHSRAQIAPTAGIALTIQNVADSMTVDGVDLLAPNASAEGESSIALSAVTSPKLHVSHSLIVAGDGAPGIAGAAVTAVTTAFFGAKRGVSLVSTGCPLPDTGSNNAACYGTAAGAKAETTSITCSTGGSVRGGGGGDGNNRYVTGVNGVGVAGTPGIPSAGATSGTSGLVGASGTAGPQGASGFGTIDANGYSPSNSGSDGNNGKPGQSGTGGRGGSSSFTYIVGSGIADNWYVGGGGSQGGLAGCGGLGGNGGGGGGASIGVLAVDSAITLDWVEIRTGTGGTGGAPSDGAAGQPGSPGAGGGFGTALAGNGQDGGDGGNGGKGGAGGPGAGGPSIAIVASGAAPALTAVTMTPGSGGLGGTGISGPNGALGESSELKLINVPDAGI